MAVVLLLFAVAFFIKYAFENRWIGELGRVPLGILAGAPLCLPGLRFHRQGWWLFGQRLTAGGVVLLYLATFGAFDYYHLIARPRQRGDKHKPLVIQFTEVMVRRLRLVVTDDRNAPLNIESVR